ncbi:ATP-binding protein [Candidatus Hydrogenedentota bacterium]
MTPFLLVEQGAVEGEKLFLVGPQTIVGRDPSVDICVRDDLLSRKHARISFSQGHCSIRDLGSSNGTYVNGERIKDALIKDGDAIRVGNHVFLFCTTEATADEIAGHEDHAADKTTHAASLSAREVDSMRSKVLKQHDENSKQSLRLRGLYETTNLLSCAFDIDGMIKGIPDLILSTISADHCHVLLVDEKTGKTSLRTGTGIGLTDDSAVRKTQLSMTIVDEAVKHGISILSSVVPEDDRFGSAKSVFSLNICSAMCVPLRGRDRILGALYADIISSDRQFREEDLETFAAVGVQVGMAIENSMLHEKHMEKARLAAIGQAMAGLGHCVKNILNGIQMGEFLVDQSMDTFAERIDDDAEATRLVKGWSILKTNYSKVQDLVLDMLAYSKEREPSLEPADPNGILEEVHELLKEKGAREGVEVRLEISENIDKVLLDERSIYRVILNLAGNAIDACGQGNASVTLTSTLTDDQAFLNLAVKDTGSGIPEEHMANLFEAFFSTKGGKGTGLGLAVSQKIAQEHGGCIEVESTVGKGTTFSVLLPYRRPESPS